MVTTRKKEVTFCGVPCITIKVHISLSALPLIFLHPTSPSGKSLEEKIGFEQITNTV